MMEHNKYAEIAVPLPIHKTFSYEIPVEMIDAIRPGMRVVVPFGKRVLTGYVVAIRDVSELKDVKLLRDILDDSPILDGQLMRLAHWISTYYISPIGEVMKAMLPAGVNQESATIITLAQSVDVVDQTIAHIGSRNQKKILQSIRNHRRIDLESLRKETRISNLGITLNRLNSAGLIAQEVTMKTPRAKVQYDVWYRLADTFRRSERDAEKIVPGAPKQIMCLKIIADRDEIAQNELLKLSGVSRSTVDALVKKGHVVRFQKERVRQYYDGESKQAPDVTVLTKDQDKVVSEIDKFISGRLFRPFLLFGVTGSGKTRVYIEVLKKTISMGRTAIVLVPEISLTPQTVRRFTRNFPGMVAVLHSRMSVGERYDSWRKLKEGEFKIAIGPRSAIFAPLKNVGLIIVDEEHESSYKQADTSPFYNARDVAVVRGKLSEAVVLLGSATPSVESFYNAKFDKYQMLTLPKRIENIPMPSVHVVDMSAQRKKTAAPDRDFLSRELIDKINEKLDLNEQIILLQNRRGFSTFIKCSDCGHIEKCINCDITLTFHIHTHRLRCHYCNFIKKAPDVCEHCGSSELTFRGIGTQQVEAALLAEFPKARLVRMDLDTTTQRKSHDRILKDFGEHRYDILLGTQMVAKGHDFGRVTMVGVISADTALQMPDFRASERTFQLLTQVAGRAGRKDRRGEVIIQTYSPEQFSIVCAKSHDYEKFFMAEILLRKELDYPPFSRIVQVMMKGENAQNVIIAINQFKESVSIDPARVKVLGPVPAPLSRIKNQYRWHMIFKVDKRWDSTGERMNAIVRDAESKIRRYLAKETVRLHVIVDPVTLF
ncbi:MAG: primosomal protein N' [candidate division KSB1 bacterium]|jgi:primosomal protein N' (replication factor Y)|nr:primosomal protein N' [candidate division KSB1 bacterium]